MAVALTARDVMTKNLVTLRIDMDVFDAVDVLLKKRISGAPVIDSKGDFAGIFSESSCMRVVVDAAYDGLPRVGLMRFVDRDPPTVSLDTDVLSICRTFIDQATRRLPVLENGKLVGQVSRRDVMRQMRKLLHTSGGNDATHAETLYLSAFDSGLAGLASRLG